MKNRLIDLNNHLFAQIERLSDESVTGEKLIEEINRSQAITDVAKQIVNNGRLALDAQMAAHELGSSLRKLPEMLETQKTLEHRQ